MKKWIAVLLPVLLALAGQAALPQPDLIVQIHYAGAGKISADRNFHSFTNEFCSAEAKAMASQTLDKLARAPFTWFKAKAAPGASDGAAQLRPLGDDLLSAEWFFEARDLPGGSPEYALVIRLPDDRARLWSQNLATVLQNWTGLVVLPDATGGWGLKKHESPNRITFRRQGDWILIDCGQDTLSLGEKVLATASREKMDTNWLSLDINWPCLAQTFSDLKTLDLPETQIAVSTMPAELYLNGKLFFPQNLSGNLPAWQIPSGIIHEPFTSFTAIRGFASWLSSQAWVQPYFISPIPNQCFTWGLNGMPFQTYAAMPFPDAEDALNQANGRLQTAMLTRNSHNPLSASFKFAKTGGMIQMQGMPFATPYLQAAKDVSGQFLLAGGFPNPPRGQPLPQALFNQLAETGLTFYHWEITALRLPQLLQVTQLSLLLSGHKQLDANSVALKWVKKTGATLGNTVTKVCQTAPDQCSFTRSAPGGLTAFEFLALASWLEAPNFPGCDLRLSLRSPRLHPHAPAVVNQPVSSPSRPTH